VAGGLLPGLVVAAANPRATDAPGQAARLTASAQAVTSASTAVDRLRARPAAAVAIDQLRQQLQVSQAEFDLRQAVRDEQAAVYALAARPDLEAATLRLLTAPHEAGLGQVTGALRAAWRLAGLDMATVRPRDTHRSAAAEPVDALLGYYRAAAGRTGVDWSYLAAINYIESDFGRVPGPSSAGALGPMQFLPDTWREYGGGGDILRASDSIQAAALFLARNGAPRNYDQAILRYNHDADYLAAVQGFAAALRSDPLWLTRFYYWSTFG
jgi:membrane-bound lytic murein transglycosylase B